MRFAVAAAVLATTVRAMEPTVTDYSTDLYTITSCAGTVTNCPAGSQKTTVTTSYIPVTTMTLYTTNIYTVTSCGPEVTNCPAASTVVTSETVALTTTVCPLSGIKTAVPTAGGAGPSNLSSHAAKHHISSYPVPSANASTFTTAVAGITGSGSGSGAGAASPLSSGTAFCAGSSVITITQTFTTVLPTGSSNTSTSVPYSVGASALPTTSCLSEASSAGAATVNGTYAAPTSTSGGVSSAAASVYASGSAPTSSGIASASTLWKRTAAAAASGSSSASAAGSGVMSSAVVASANVTATSASAYATATGNATVSAASAATTGNATATLPYGTSAGITSIWTSVVYSTVSAQVPCSAVPTLNAPVRISDNGTAINGAAVQTGSTVLAVMAAAAALFLA